FDLTLHPGAYLAPPGSVRNGAGQPYRIFTPFWRALTTQMPPAPPLPPPARLDAPGFWPDSDRLSDWGLLPLAPDWAGGMRAEWTPG
ncbi:deoxyribodipyrimidine photo-lyase, partial [Klebsiella pneumoniae]|uniref:deoxyribodipyrimidine photo-lyase n=1 Tax=Klebsiella pneumoniae TaxID=573 RepID=UPI003853DDDC